MLSCQERFRQARGEYLRPYPGSAEVPAAEKSTGEEIDTLRWIQSERYASAVRRRTGKPPEVHRGSVRVESGERASERNPNRRESDAAWEF